MTIVKKKERIEDSEDTTFFALLIVFVSVTNCEII